MNCIILGLYAKDVAIGFMALFLVSLIIINILLNKLNSVNRSQDVNEVDEEK